MSKDIDEKLPGNWDSVEATEIFALLIILTTLTLASIDGLSLQDTIVQMIVYSCIATIFGTKMLKGTQK